MSYPSDFLTSVARFFVKFIFTKNVAFFEACKKVTDFFDTLKKQRTGPLFFIFPNCNQHEDFLKIFNYMLTNASPKTNTA